jgi:hypothetical protein
MFPPPGILLGHPPTTKMEWREWLAHTPNVQNYATAHEAVELGPMYWIRFAECEDRACPHREHSWLKGFIPYLQNIILGHDKFIPHYMEPQSRQLTSSSAQRL